MSLNWKNAADYAYAKSLTKHGIAWEYLRRNAEYRKCWASYLKLKEELEAVYGPFHSWPKIENDLDLWFYDPPRNNGETYNEWLNRCFDLLLEPQRERHHIGMAWQWGLWELYDPSQKATGNEKFLPRINPRIWNHAEEVSTPSLDTIRGDFVYIEIDLRQRVTPQIAQARRRLLARQKNFVKNSSLVLVRDKKPRVTNFILHLRILDAYEANKSVKSSTIRKDIAKALWGKTTYDGGDNKDGQYIDELRKEAVRYRDGDYRSLV